LNTNTEILKELHSKELKNGLYDVKFFGFPIWRLIRFEVRTKYLKSKTGHTNRTLSSSPNYGGIIKFYFKSAYQLASLIFKKDIKNKYVFFAFPRLIKVEDAYFDRFTDTIIANEKLVSQAIIFQRSLTGNYLLPRMHSENTIYSDFIDITSKMLSIVLIPILPILYISKAFQFYRKGKKMYPFSFLKLIVSINSFLIESAFYSILYFLIKPKNIFLVNREVFFPQLFISKKFDIPVYEFQHGITRNETALYTGIFSNYADPDKLLVFGDPWVNHYFGLPTDRILNIGWAYKEFVNSHLRSLNTLDKKHVLVISSPAITDKILNFIIRGVEFNSSIIFNLRLHPQEVLNEKQLNLIKNIKNINVVDNQIDSVISIKEHNLIIGDNSSVLFEALSLGKKVGRINMLGILSSNIEEDIEFGLNVISEFLDLVNLTDDHPTHTHNVNENIYSNFKKDIFNQLINIK
jgi:hypothetical protein